jgi:hypothetical protein
MRQKISQATVMRQKIRQATVIRMDLDWGWEREKKMRGRFFHRERRGNE